jgi:hypothetical protein
MALGLTGKATTFLLLLLAILLITCGEGGRTERLATYLQEEKRLRAKALAPATLRDSLENLRQEYGIDTEAEWSQLGADPSEWIKLLRKLSRE